MRKLILWLEIAIILGLCAGVLFALTMITIGIDGVLTVELHHYALGCALAVAYALTIVSAKSEIDACVQLYRIARSKARLDTYVVRCNAQSAMRDFRSEVQAWQSAANRGWSS